MLLLPLTAQMDTYLDPDFFVQTLVMRIGFMASSSYATSLERSAWYSCPSLFFTPSCPQLTIFAQLCLFNANVPFAKGKVQNAYQGQLPHGLNWGMTREDVHHACLKPSSEDTSLNVEWFPSGMGIIYDKKPADRRLQRIQCILLKEGWAGSSGSVAASQPTGLRLNLSPAEQEEQDKIARERMEREAAKIIQIEEEKKRKERAQFLVQSLHHSIASLNRSAIQAEFDELFKLNDHLAFGILFPLVGAGCIHQVELLLRRNSVQCCEKLDKDGRNALHEAASRNAVEVAEALHRASKDKINFLNLKVTNSTNPIFQLICNPRP
jgi:hypothetical protein